MGLRRLHGWAIQCSLQAKSNPIQINPSWIGLNWIGLDWFFRAALIQQSQSKRGQAGLDWIGLNFSSRLNPTKSIQAGSSLRWINRSLGLMGISKLCIVGNVETTNRTFHIFPDEIVATVSNRRRTEPNKPRTDNPTHTISRKPTNVPQLGDKLLKRFICFAKKIGPSVFALACCCFLNSVVVGVPHSIQFNIIQSNANRIQLDWNSHGLDWIDLVNPSGVKPTLE